MDVCPSLCLLATYEPSLRVTFIFLSPNIILAVTAVQTDGLHSRKMRRYIIRYARRSLLPPIFFHFDRWPGGLM